MATNYPSSADDGTTLPDPSAGDFQNSPSHSSLHGNANGAIKALEAKVGTGATTPTANTLLRGTGTGTSAWGSLTSAQLASAISDETGSGSLVFATTPTLVTPKVDTINENTPSNGVTVAGLNLKSGKLNTNSSVVEANITDAAVSNAKLKTGAGEPGGAWTSWTPTLANITLGNGTVVAAYKQVGKTIVAEFVFTMGSSSAMGSAPTFTLPVATLGSRYSSLASPIGTVVASDAGVNTYAALAFYSSSTVCRPRLINAASTIGVYADISSTSPFTWGTGDQLVAQLMYEAA